MALSWEKPLTLAQAGPDDTGCFQSHEMFLQRDPPGNRTLVPLPVRLPAAIISHSQVSALLLPRLRLGLFLHLPGTVRKNWVE